jgi:hypothetical protein
MQNRDMEGNKNGSITRMRDGEACGGMKERHPTKYSGQETWMKVGEYSVARPGDLSSSPA